MRAVVLYFHDHVDGIAGVRVFRYGERHLRLIRACDCDAVCDFAVGQIAREIDQKSEGVIRYNIVGNFRVLIGVRLKVAPPAVCQRVAVRVFARRRKRYRLPRPR